MKARIVVSSLTLVGGFFLALPLHPHVAQTTDSRCGIVRGRVVDQKGIPVSGARVYSMIMDRPPRGRSADRGTETDENGVFYLGCVEQGTNGIYVSKEADYYPDTSLTMFITKLGLAPVLNIAGGQVINGVEVRLGPKAGRLTGQVVDANTGKTIEGAVLSICRNGRNPECRQLNANNSSQGFSQLLPPIAFTVRASAPGYEQGTSILVQIKPSSVKTLIIPLKRNTRADR